MVDYDKQTELATLLTSLGYLKSTNSDVQKQQQNPSENPETEVKTLRRKWKRLH
jgi:hypothetical protein